MTGRPARNKRWLGERNARLGFLIGLGWDARRIAADAIIATTRFNVYQQAALLGLSFRRAAWERAALPAEFADYFSAAAAKRGLATEDLIHNILCVLAEDPCLIDNILDDGA